MNAHTFCTAAFQVNSSDKILTYIFYFEHRIKQIHTHTQRETVENTIQAEWIQEICLLAHW